MFRYGVKIGVMRANTIDTDGLHTWQYPDSELEKLRDPSIKLLCLVNPSNPPSVALDDASRARLVSLVKNERPDLIIISDDVYGTFVPHYRSLLADLPYNTACVYSFRYGVKIGVMRAMRSPGFTRKLHFRL